MPFYGIILSSSNGSIIKSINARAMPGVNIKTNNFITLPFATSWLEVKANFAHYFMDDTRFVDNTNLHHKSLYFKTTLSPTLDNSRFRSLRPVGRDLTTVWRAT